jgi:thiosulfate/3-mercaptopyruvate sulfurtransferase
MPTLVSTEWVQKRLDSTDVLVLDPRSAVQYMKGHLKEAVNLQVAQRLLDGDSELLPVETLEGVLGSVGLDDTRIPVIYDRGDGRNGALLAWLLEYLGRSDVCLMDVFYEQWLAEDREVFYRPVKLQPAAFAARVRPEMRATAAEVASGRGLKLLDVRSEDEYKGAVGTDDRPGHIPGAVNVVWQRFNGHGNKMLTSVEELQGLLSEAGLSPKDDVVVYCRVGQRAALGYLALQQLGLNVRLYDGSYADWMRRGMPVEQ